MLKRLRNQAHEEEVELCERCGRVCDSACRAGAGCEGPRTSAMPQHGRVV